MEGEGDCVNLTHGRESGAADDDVLFSPMANPTAPGGEMLGERNPDSVLFDIRKLDDDDEREASSARAGKGSTEEEASGLIDVKKVLAETSAEAAPLAINPLAPTPSSAEPEPVPEPTSDRVRTTLLLASIVTLLFVGALLAVKAMS
jgi:hypothetical protein